MILFSLFYSTTLPQNYPAAPFYFWCMTTQRFAPIVWLIFILIIQESLLAQAPQLSASVSRQRIALGDTLTLHLQSQYALGLRQDLSSIADTLGRFEVLARSKAQTSEQNGKHIFAQDFTLIAFEAGNDTIPALKVAYVQKESGMTNSLATAPIAIYIDSVATDMQQDIKPIRPIIDLPLTWRDYWHYIAFASLAVLALIAAVVWYRRRNIAPPTHIATPTELPRPPHEIALSQLNTLAQARYWQQGKIKQYYSELSDIMRRYIEQRYTLPATEMITAETITALQMIGQTSQPISSTTPLPDADKPLPYSTDQALSPAQISDIEQLLRTADMVKFAKAQPSIDTHTHLWQCAEQWIRQTRSK